MKNVIYQPELGEWFFQEFLVKKHITAFRLASSINVIPTRISLLIHGRSRFSPLLDALLCKFYELPQGYFLKKQMEYDIEDAKKSYEKRIKAVIVIYKK